MATIVIVILVLMLLGAFPTWNHSRQWGYGPSGGLGLVLVVSIVPVLFWAPLVGLNPAPDNNGWR